jgi:alanine racemase
MTLRKNTHTGLTWAEIDMNAFRNNFRLLKSCLQPEVKFMGVVKANAYGHGAVRIARELEELGADFLGVSNCDEALNLRTHGIKLPILVFGYTKHDSFVSAINGKVTLTICDEESLRYLAEVAKSMNLQVPIHIQVDTGLRLFGATISETKNLFERAKQYPNIITEGVYSHFAESDSPDLQNAIKQLEQFQALVNYLEISGNKPPIVHMANSAAIVRIPDAHFNMVRAGTFLYGEQTGQQLVDFVPKQILTLKTTVVSVFDVNEGLNIGYGQSTIAKHNMRLATIPIGYADGFRKHPHWGFVSVNNKNVPVISSVSMDKSVIDISEVPETKIGDIVALIDPHSELTRLTNVASRMHAGNYEILTTLGERIKRHYL